tara:strand:- start:440 stop:823 length:384 start_codon:yes stop_codon:yes gene_type:complete
MKHVAKIINGQIVFTDKNKLDAELQSFENQSVTVTITKNIPRSININKYYWSVVVNVPANHLGYDKEEMHETFKDKFLYKKEFINDEWVKIKLSTTKITNAQMIEYIDRIKRFCTQEFGIYIPDPNE